MSLYMDQNYTELYDVYDYKAKEPTPDMLLQKTRSDRGIVHIDYPMEGMFSLEGSIGRASFYEEAGKKAFVRGGTYEHPTKGWASSITYMSPYEYIEYCIDLFTKRGSELTIEEIIDSRRNEYDLEEVFGGASYGHIFYPTIDLYGNGQEGLHRAIYAMDQDEGEIPVIVIAKL